VGIEDVAIGSDFTQNQPEAFFTWIRMGKLKKQLPVDTTLSAVFPPWIETPQGFSTITKELLNRGYMTSEIQKILGGNWLRLFTEVW
jgi:microsomal dipeptidase-like Zn-dependent dipeptidase